MKPVAWLNGNEICPEIGYESTITTEHPKNLGWIPLYTHQVKELTLTDEDILEEWTCKYSDCYQDTLIEFARAILRKAQKK